MKQLIIGCLLLFPTVFHAQSDQDKRWNFDVGMNLFADGLHYGGQEGILKVYRKVGNATQLYASTGFFWVSKGGKFEEKLSAKYVPFSIGVNWKINDNWQSQAGLGTTIVSYSDTRFFSQWQMWFDQTRLEETYKDDYFEDTFGRVRVWGIVEGVFRRSLARNLGLTFGNKIYISEAINKNGGKGVVFNPQLIIGLSYQF